MKTKISLSAVDAACGKCPHDDCIHDGLTKTCKTARKIVRDGAKIEKAVGLIAMADIIESHIKLRESELMEEDKTAAMQDAKLLRECAKDYERKYRRATA